MKAEVAEDELEALGEAFFALSNATRLRLLYMLTEPGYQEEIAKSLGISRQSVSKHLRKLEDHGFVEEIEGWRSTGPVKEFQVDPKRLFALGMTLVDLGKLEPEGDLEGHEQDPTQMLTNKELPTQSPPEDRRGAHLLMLDGPRAGERFKLDGEGPRWTIGRSEDRDLQLDHDPYISSHQCEIQLDPSGHAVVDTYSANGTYVNYGRLPEGGRAALAPGDVVRVGRTNIVYQRA